MERIGRCKDLLRKRSRIKAESISITRRPSDEPKIVQDKNRISQAPMKTRKRDAEEPLYLQRYEQGRN